MSERGQAKQDHVSSSHKFHAALHGRETAPVCILCEKIFFIYFFAGFIYFFLSPQAPSTCSYIASAPNSAVGQSLTHVEHILKLLLEFADLVAVA